MASAGTLTTRVLSIGKEGTGVFEIQKDSSPEINISSELRLGPHAVFEAGTSAHIHMTGSAFINESTAPKYLAGLANLTLIFEGGPGVDDTFEVAGQDLGPFEAGFASNFALGTLAIGGAQEGHVGLVDAVDNQPSWTGAEALYVDLLEIAPGSALDLSGLTLYYRMFKGDRDSVNLDGGTIMLASEPTTLSLLAVGGLLALRRRRAGR